MASIRFRKDYGYWEIRKYVTDPRTRRPKTFTKYLPATASRTEIAKVADHLDSLAQRIKNGRVRIPGTCQTAYEFWLDYMAQYPTGRKRKQFTQRTQDHYKEVIARFIDGLPRSTKKITQLTRYHVECYNERLLNNGLTCRTVNANLTAIKSFSRWLSDMYGIQNFAEDIPMYTESEPNQRFLTDEEYPVILEAGDVLFRQRFEFIGNTGLRATEFCNLRWCDITPDKKAIQVHGKGNKIRYVPLNRICHRILDELKSDNRSKSPNSPIFTASELSGRSKNRKLDRKILYCQCAAIAERLNIKSFGPHAFRHYFATSLLVKGVPIAHVAKILGHASIRTTERIYAHILPEHLQGITECLCE